MDEDVVAGTLARSQAAAAPCRAGGGAGLLAAALLMALSGRAPAQQAGGPTAAETTRTTADGVGRLTENPPQGLFNDDWMIVLLDGQKAGYSHSTQVRDGDEIVSSTEVRMKISRAGTAVDITMRDETRETLAGQPVEFSSEINLAQQPIRMTGRVAEGKVTVKAEQYGSTTTQVVDYPKGALMGWGGLLEQRRYELKPGTHIVVNMYVPMQNLTQAVPTELEILEAGQVELDGRTVPGFKTRSTVSINGVKIESTGWVDDQWEPLRQEMRLFPGVVFEMVRSTRSEALGELIAAEMFAQTFIPVRRALERDRLESVTYRIAAREGGTIPDFPETAMQKVISRTPGELRLQVSRIDHAGLAKRPAQPPPAGFEPFLQSTVFITSDDARVREMAAQAQVKDLPRHEAADRLRRLVSREIEYKGLGTAFATAAEVCRTRQGDCTEHGVLLAALGRAAGIPTRVVTGLIYVPSMAGQENVLGFHMWTQFWVNGAWVDLDAAFDQTDCDPTHLALGVHSMEDASMGSLVSGVMLKMSELTIHVEDVQLKP